MNINLEICAVKNLTLQNIRPHSKLVILIFAAIITALLLILKQTQLLSTDPQFIIYPFVVLTLLAYGDKLILLFILTPLTFTSKIANKLKGIHES